MLHIRPSALPIAVLTVLLIAHTSVAVGPTQATDAITGLKYRGGPVLANTEIYVVFWGWHGVDPHGEAAYLIAFLQGIGGSPWASVLTQYPDGAARAYENPPNLLKGVWWDNALYHEGGLPPLVDYIEEEALRAAEHFQVGNDAIIFVARPPFLNDPMVGLPNGYCAWHSWTSPRPGNFVFFVNLPYIPDVPAGACGTNFVNSGAAGKLDGVSIVAGHEFAETLTDPMSGNGWIDDVGSEVGDRCAWIDKGPGAAANIELSTGRFAVQSLWSNRDNSCILNG